MGKTAIFLHGQNGDVMSAASALHYRKELFGDDELVWYIADENRDLLKYQDIELRTFPRGFGYPKMVEEENRKLIAAGKDPIWEDWQPLVDRNNHLDIELKKNYPSLADIDRGYFPGPHQMSPIQRHGLSYPNCSKKVFGIDFAEPWHPVLEFSEEERQDAKTFIESMNGGKLVFIESFAGSSQSVMGIEMINESMNSCFEILGTDCNFIFGSHKFLRKQERFPEGLFDNISVHSASNFTVRQTALVAERCHLMISVSSGLSVAASAWGLNSPPIIQFCGSKVCSTADLANGKFVLITADDKKMHEAKKEYQQKLVNMLIKIKQSEL